MSDRVEQLIGREKGSWDADLVKNNFLAHEAEVILGIPISTHSLRIPRFGHGLGMAPLLSKVPMRWHSISLRKEKSKRVGREARTDQR